MKIIKLTSENIKKIKAIEIEPTSNVVKVTGKNAQGKSSVLDSIQYALAGGRSVPEKVIRDGESEAHIELDLGDIVVTKTFKDGKQTLKVLTKEGAAYPRAQEKLSELVGSLTFDPLEFSRYESKKQKEILVKLTGVDSSDLDNQYKKAYEERTFIGRIKDQLKGELDGFSAEITNDSTLEEIDVVELSKELTSIQEKVSEGDQILRQIHDYSNEISRLNEEIKRLDALRMEASNKYDPYSEMKTERLDRVEIIREQISIANEVNQKVRVKAKYDEVNSKYQAELAKYDVKSNEIETLKEAKTNMISNAKMPIQGLSFGEDGVLFNNIPFEQLSSAEKLKVSLSIAMALNPELRIIRILDGSLLDSDNMKVIEEMAHDKDYQVWIEQVDESGQIGFVIEDGQVKVAN